MTEQGRLMKYTVGHYRKEGVTPEDFINWLTKEHLPLAVPIFKRHGIKKYTLFITPQALGDAMRTEMAKYRPTWDVGDFDCILEYWFYDIKALENMVADPDRASKAVKDEDKWCDLSRSTVHIGYDTPFLLETGETVNLGEGELSWPPWALKKFGPLEKYE